MANTKGLSTREWIFIIIIISLSEACIAYIAFVNAKNGSALNYVSFAGTLISIILAILAIGYTYGESISEKNKSNALVNQIEILSGVVNNIELQSANLDNIGIINEELIKLSNKFNEETFETHKRIDSVKEIATIVKERLTTNDGIVTSGEQKIDYKLLLSMNYMLIQVPLLMIYYLQLVKGTSLNIIDKTREIFTETENKCKEEGVDLGLVNRDFSIGITMTIYMLLKESDLLKENSGEIELNINLVAGIKRWKVDSIEKNYLSILFNTTFNKIKSISE
ncbi:MAG TPA: hypothetical protein VK705_02725 [Ferruginibacter sp.]|jgi:hypothetical protein|nr:hypothetical protein [Ferruginibacter sp.]